MNLHPSTASIGALLLLIHPSARADDSKPITFSLTLMGDMLDNRAAGCRLSDQSSSGVHLGFKKFEKPNGEQLWMHDGEFRTAEEATKYMELENARAAVSGPQRRKHGG